MRSSLGVRGWLVVSGILLLAAGGCLGFLAATLLGHGQGEPVEAEAQVLPLAPEIIRPYDHPTDSSIYKMLDLKPVQTVQANRILAEHFQNLRRLRGEIESLGVKVQSDLQGLLDPGQREQMADLLRSIKINEVTRQVSEQVAFYRRELGLTEQQDSDVSSILLSDRVERDKIFRDLRAQRRKGEKVDFRNQGGAAFKRLDEDLNAKLKSILDDGQMKKFQKLQEAWRRPWGRGTQREGKQQAPPPPPPAKTQPCPPGQPQAPAPAAPPAS
jgi:hypothetical protein